ncbi:MAG: bifunctional riboflavin kinase/FAD synthetase [Dehalococcoidia bacterium]|nr:bifunctional riboflavin kinase/FAD synthetase [Dehalococcoidia bacterium]
MSTPQHAQPRTPGGEAFRRALAEAAPPLGVGTVITIGVFDGVHRGHRHLLQRMFELAEPPLVPTVITFTNHPAEVVNPERSVTKIITPEEKVDLLYDAGVGCVICVEFTNDLANLDANEFTHLLVDCLHMRGIVTGPDFALGRNRSGNLEYLRRRGQAMGFWVETVAPLEVEGSAIRSRRVRNALADGNVDGAEYLLGRPYATDGVVVHGAKMGRQLGFPTANIIPTQNFVIPADGVYATYATVNGVRHMAATSIGVRPTFGLSQRLIEAHLLDFSDDIYDENLRLEFVSRLRGQETFDGIEALITQMNLDVSNARSVLEEHDRLDHA